MKLKVAIQTYKHSGHQGRGIGVYGAQLVAEIKKNSDVEVYEFGDIREIGEVDLVHFLHFDLFQKTLPSYLNVPMVVTVHDVTPLIFPQHYPSGLKGKLNLFWQKRALRKATQIITVSEVSKRDIVKYLKVDEGKIEVIYSGVGQHFKKITDVHFLKKVANTFQLPEKFAFYSGNVNWNKNILNITEACIHADLDLVIVGKSFSERDNLDHPEMKNFKQFLDKYEHHPKVHILGYVSDEDMVGILNQASVALFVSYYEGFGFPILEAQACEVPVITSNCSSMPEIGGEGALFVNPNKVEEIRSAIKEITLNQLVKERLIKAGNNNVKKFSWEKCAEQTIAVYKKVMS